MDIFRYEKHVPDVYVNESRDFQVLLRLLTFGLSGAKNNAECLKYLNDAKNIPNTLLSLLQTKVGFYTTKSFSDDILRKLLGNFIELVKKKGMREGIADCILLFYSAYHVYSSALITITNYSIIQGTKTPVYEISIGLQSEVRDFTLLKELLRYVIPFGYKLSIYFYDSTSYITSIENSNAITWQSTPLKNNIPYYAWALGTAQTDSGYKLFGRIDTLPVGIKGLTD